MFGNFFVHSSLIFCTWNLQFRPHSSRIFQINNSIFCFSDVHSTLVVGFLLQRHMGNFVIQVYGPCILLVVISWVSFWLNREATSDRISLGVTTVLTMTFLGLEARTDLPQVAYPTALDYFVFISFVFIFSTVVQVCIQDFIRFSGATVIPQMSKLVQMDAALVFNFSEFLKFFSNFRIFSNFTIHRV